MALQDPISQYLCCKLGGGRGGVYVSGGFAALRTSSIIHLHPIFTDFVKLL
jgi:hypothetical protein